jgi:hypothetical protein
MRFLFYSDPCWFYDKFTHDLLGENEFENNLRSEGMYTRMNQLTKTCWAQVVVQLEDQIRGAICVPAVLQRCSKDVEGETDFS